MKKLILGIAIICLNGFLVSCSNQDDADMQLYENTSELYATGGEDEQTPPPPPPPPSNGGGN